MSLRILYHHRIRAEDGQAVHVRELIGGLRSLGHEVLECALVPKADGQQIATPQAGVLQGKGVSKEGVSKAGVSKADTGGLWQKLSLPRPAVEILEMLYDRQGVRMLMRAAETFKPDFIYERHALHCSAGLVAARKLAVPLLLEVNSPMCDEMKRLGKLCFPKRARRTERQVLAGADQVLAVTEVLRGDLIDLGAPSHKTRVIQNGAVPARYDAATQAAGHAIRARLGIPEDAFVTGFVGYMRPWHRLDVAVDALAQDGLSHAHLLLVGEGPALEDVMAQAERLGVKARVHAVGAVPGALVPAHVCVFDAALIPAINAYASPLKLFDYFAAGACVLAPRQANLEELVRDGETGILFDAPEDLTRHLCELATHRGRANQIGAAGRQSLLDKDWTWVGNARRVASAFAEVQV